MWPLIDKYTIGITTISSHCNSSSDKSETMIIHVGYMKSAVDPSHAPLILPLSLLDHIESTFLFVKDYIVTQAHPLLM